MIGGSRPFPRTELDVFSAALGCGLVAAALSLVAPELTALAGTLAALTFAGWCARIAPVRPIARVLGRLRPLLALSVAGMGAILYGFPGPIAAFRGIVVVVALVPLWWFGRPAAAPYAVEGVAG